MGKKKFVSFYKILKAISIDMETGFTREWRKLATRVFYLVVVRDKKVVYSNFFVGTCVQVGRKSKKTVLLRKTVPLASKAARVGFYGIIYTYVNCDPACLKQDVPQT